MKERKNNVNTLLWLMVTLSAMMMFLTLSSCKSSVQNGNGKTPNPGPETVKITVIAPKEGGNIKVNGEVLKETKEFTQKIGDTMAFEAVPDVDYYAEWNTVSGLVINEDDPKIASLTVAFDSTIDLNSSNPMKKVDFEFIKKYISFNKDSDIVYDIDGMGFGGKNEGKLYYLTYGYNPDTHDRDINYKSKNWSSEEIALEINSDSWKPSTTVSITDISSCSIHSALEARWLSTYNTKYFYPNRKNWLSAPGIHVGDDSTVKKMRTFMGRGYLFAVQNNENVKIVYTECTNSIVGYFADWQFVFIKKGENEGYTFHFGPYWLSNADSLDYSYAPGVSEDVKNGETGVLCSHDISAMFEDCLKKDRKINLSKSKIQNLVSDFKTKFYKEIKEYDIYMIPRKVDNESHNYTPKFVWSSVFKLNADDYWQECFKD